MMRLLTSPAVINERSAVTVAHYLVVHLRVWVLVLEKVFHMTYRRGITAPLRDLHPAFVGNFLSFDPPGGDGSAMAHRHTTVMHWICRMIHQNFSAILAQSLQYTETDQRHNTEGE